MKGIDKDGFLEGQLIPFIPMLVPSKISSYTDSIIIASCNGQLTIVSGWVQSMTWDLREKGIAPVNILCMGSSVCVYVCVYVCVHYSYIASYSCYCYYQIYQFSTGRRTQKANKACKGIYL